MSLYQLEHLTRAYGRRTVLAIDQLEIEAGRMYALLGPNGAGKTTLLNLLAFLDEPTSGSLRFHDKAVGSDRPSGSPCAARWCSLTSTRSCFPPRWPRTSSSV